MITARVNEQPKDNIYDLKYIFRHYIYIILRMI